MTMKSAQTVLAAATDLLKDVAGSDRVSSRGAVLVHAGAGASACGAGVRPEVDEDDPKSGQPPTLSNTPGLERKRRSRPSVGFAQRLLNNFFSHLLSQGAPRSCIGRERVEFWLQGVTLPLAVDCVFGPQTERATKAFQACHALQQDGIIGPITWTELLYWVDRSPPRLSLVIRSDTDGSALRREPVAVFAGKNQLASLRTDSQGRLNLNGLRPGDYQLGVRGARLRLPVPARAAPPSAIAGGSLVGAVPPSSLGQANAGSGSFSLVCDLASPLIAGAMARYEVIGPLGPEVDLLWKLTDTSTGQLLAQRQGPLPEWRIGFRIPGNYRVSVECSSSASARACAVFAGGKLLLDQAVSVESAAMTSVLDATPDPIIARELFNDLRAYIVASANATGPNGLTPRCLATVLFLETLQRPKADREGQNADVQEDFQTFVDGGTLLPILDDLDKSLGVGQMKSSTAAMALGLTPLVEMERDNRAPGQKQTRANYDALSVSQKRDILTLLRFPKSNIAIVARWLTRLKNRPNRFASLPRTAFSASAHAFGVIATEYNAGPTKTPAAAAGASDYGKFAVSSLSSIGFLTLFPDV